MLKRFIRNEEGATAIEYSLIAVGISIAIAAVVILVGDQLVIMFNDVLAKLSS